MPASVSRWPDPHWRELQRLVLFFDVFCYFQRQSGALLHVMVARMMNNVAHHAYNMCGVGMGWGGAG